MPYFVVKSAPVLVSNGARWSFDEKTMYRGKAIRVGDPIFVFASDHQGGRGLVARGIVTAVSQGRGNRVAIGVRRTAIAQRPLGRSELAAFRERRDDSPQTEIARKLYRQATNKIAGITDQAARFIGTHFGD